MKILYPRKFRAIIKGSFKKNILLIDDVYTTGATINECKKNIEKCNINKIYLLTIAKSNI